MLWGRFSTLARTVPPVVVRPETASKNASTSSMCGRSESMRGRAPRSESATQNRVTTRNPSEPRISGRRPRVTTQKTKPMTSMSPKATPKGAVSPSPYHQPIAIGGSMETLNIIVSSPSR